MRIAQPIQNNTLKDKMVLTVKNDCMPINDDYACKFMTSKCN